MTTLFWFAEAAMNIRWLLVAAAALLAGCTTLPSGPSALAMPGSRASAEQFAADDARCRAYAASRLGNTTPTDAANQSAVASTVAGTAIGAAVGGLMDGSSGARWGAGMGLMFGALSGLGASQTSYAITQRQYDSVYFPCMYSAGHRVPVPIGDEAAYRARYGAAAPPAGSPPPSNLPPPDYRPEGPPKR